MTKENIIEGNKLFAEFLNDEKFGLIGKTDFHDGNNYVDTFNLPSGTPYKFNELKFHKDWNWLMQVVEKIESIKDKKTDIKFDVVINVKVCCVGGVFEYIYQATAETKIEATWIACLEFVKWYNKQNNGSQN